MKNYKGILTGFAATLWMFMGTDAMGEQGSLTPPDAPGETMEGRTDSSDPIAVQFTTPTSGVVSVAVYGEDDVQLRELVIGQRLEAGKHQVWWDGRDQNGKHMAAGSYPLKGLVADLAITPVMFVGNTGDPPWDWNRSIHGGNFIDVAAGENGSFYVLPQFAEENRHIQKLDAAGRVLWNSPIEPGSGPETAIAADEKHVYIATTMDKEQGQKTKAHLPREVIWRLAADTGMLVPWSNGRSLLDLNEVRPHQPSRKVGRRKPTYDIPPTKAGVHGMAVGVRGLYVSLYHDDLVALYDSETGKRKQELKVPKPRGLWIDNTGFLFVVSQGRVLRFSADGSNRDVVVSQGLEDPYDVAVATNGMLYVSDLGSSQQIRRYAPNGTALTPLGQPGGGLHVPQVEPNRFSLPLGIAIDSAGRLLVTDYGNGRLQRFTNEGRCDLSVISAGYGGENGGIDVLREEPERLFFSGINSIGRNLVEYGVDYDSGSWTLNRIWQDITPLYAKEPLFVRRINGRIFIFLLARNPMVLELNGNQLSFCTTLVTSSFHIDHIHWPGVREDVQRLHLIGEDGHFNCNFVWTDTNRNRRMEKEEVTRFPGEKFYTVNDADVSDDGDLIMHDHYTASIVRFPCLGMDAAGNLLYRWDRKEVLWSLEASPTRLNDNDLLTLWAERLKMMGTRIDEHDNVYLSDIAGENWMDPPAVSIRKYAPGRRLMWDIGRKAEGEKDKPGEFNSVPSFCGIHKDLLFINEYFGQLDVYSLDGLYVATLLEEATFPGHQPSPLKNWGEHFFSTVFTHSRTGVTYAFINTHNFQFPCYRIDGIEKIERFEGEVLVNGGLP